MTSASLEVVCATDAGVLAEFETAWRDLVERASVGEWFAGPDWVLPWMESFGQSHQLVVYFVLQKNTLVGAVPFATHTRRRIGSSFLASPFNSHTRRMGWIAEAEHDNVIRAVVSHIRSHHPFAAVGLPHLKDGTLADQVRRVQRDLHLGAWNREESSSALAEWPSGWDTYLKQREVRFMRNLRRHLRRTSEESEWRVTQFRGISELAKGWRQLLDVERQSWKHGQRTSIDSEPGAEPFYRSVAERFAARDRLALWLLSFRDEPVAHALVVESRSTAYLLKNSFAEQFRAHSPGVALVWRALQQSASSGLRRFDFLGDAEPWKIPLSTQIPRHYSWKLYPRYHLMGQAESFTHQVVRPTYRWLRGLRRPTATHSATRDTNTELD